MLFCDILKQTSCSQQISVAPGCLLFLVILPSLSLILGMVPEDPRTRQIQSFWLCFMNGEVIFLWFCSFGHYLQEVLRRAYCHLVCLYHLWPEQSLGNPSRDAFPCLGCFFNMACAGLEITGGHLDIARVCEHAHAGHMMYTGDFWRLRSAKSVD